MKPAFSRFNFSSNKSSVVEKLIPKAFGLNYNLPAKVKIIDTSCRDGLQTFSSNIIIPVSLKYELLSKLSQCGIKHLECGAFVNPKISPNMANSGDLFDKINSNKKSGLLKCIDYGIKNVAIIGSASNSHCEQNLNMNLETNIKNICEVIDIASINNINVRIGMAAVFGCPFEGKIEPFIICDIFEQFMKGVNNNNINKFDFMIGDTLGIANPFTTNEMLNEMLNRFGNNFLSNRLHLHFHNTMGQALINSLIGLTYGVCTFDTCIAGLGGPPSHYSYANATAGNLNTVDLVYMLDSLNIETGIDCKQLNNVSKWFLNEIEQTRLKLEQ